ncbi:hypothetical protein [Streptomyces sp. NPDC091371]|uniref:hypothetical protein n=1 Tax=Streptomyces sp. NPDC091371 TaxID=3155303 RepID=UPI003444DC5F
MSTEGDGPPRQRLTGFLRAQARQAGLGSRAIAARLQADQAASARAAADKGAPDPLATVRCSNSQVDRAMNGQGPVPPWPFVREFLKVTSRASGLSAQEYRDLCETAKGLVRAVADEAVAVTASVDGGSDTVAVLRLEVELERARHKETRLRYSLRDAQLFIATMCFIVNELREIIADRDALLARLHHGPGDARRIAAVRDEAEQALALKHTAETESELAVARVRRLEGFWDQARREVQRLALHPDAAELGPSPAHGPGPGPGPGLVPQEFLARPALDDIAGALAKARALNATEDEAVRELAAEPAPGTEGSQPADDEFSVLVAATRLGTFRREAVELLVRDWTGRPETGEVLLRMVDDPDDEIRRMAVGGLADACPGDPVVLAALLRLARPGGALLVCQAVLHALPRGWPGDPRARALCLEMTEDFRLRPDALAALVTGWAADPVVRDHLLALVDGPEQGWRAALAKVLEQGWRGDAATFGVLMRMAVQFDDPPTQKCAIEALGSGWPGDPRVRAVFMEHISRRDRPGVAVAAAKQLASGWPGDPAIEAVLDRLSDDLGGMLPQFGRLAAEYERSMKRRRQQP